MFENYFQQYALLIMACADYKGFAVTVYMFLLFNLLFNQLLDFMNGSWDFSVSVKAL